MDKRLYDNYLTILRNELVPALGCTEPIAVAYCAAVAAARLGCTPEKMDVYCSGNIIKNVRGVTVPNSGGMKGIEAAAVLGAFGGDQALKLEVLSAVKESDRARAIEYISGGYCKVHLQEGGENLYVRCEFFSGKDFVSAELKTRHDHISRIIKNGRVVYEQSDIHEAEAGDKSLMTLEGIYDFACGCEISDVLDLMDDQISKNMALSAKGMEEPWGADVGKTYLSYAGNDVRARAQAFAAAGSDARMSGCDLPAVINSGSGNQGVTVSVPVVVYARSMGSEHEKLVRALVLANLISLHQKKYIGSLSCYCGATSAAAGAVCGIGFLKGDSYQVICGALTNTVATIGGMICDGAKPSCAGKIRSAVDTALFALEQAEKGSGYLPGSGIVGDDAEQTVKNIGRVGRIGMAGTDIEVLNIMIGT